MTGQTKMPALRATTLFAERDVRNSAEVVLRSPAIVLVTLRGNVGAAWAPGIAGAVRIGLGKGKRMYAFWDLEHLDSYDALVRKRCTEALLGRRDNLAGVHALSTSRIVSMGVSIANLALGGMIVSHRERESFEQALEHASDGGAAR